MIDRQSQSPPMTSDASPLYVLKYDVKVTNRSVVGRGRMIRYIGQQTSRVVCKGTTCLARATTYDK